MYVTLTMISLACSASSDGHPSNFTTILDPTASARAVMLLENETQEDKTDANDDIGTDLDEFFFSGHSIRFEVGGNFAFDSNIRGDPSSGNSFSSGTIKFDTGVDFLFTWGIPVWDELSLELSTGFAYNSVKTLEGTWNGGQGNVNGVPLVIGVGYAIDVTDQLAINLNVAVGAQFSYADITGITSAGAAGTTASINANAISFRYQVGATLDWDFTHDFGLGAYVRYAGTTETDFGTPDFTGPNPSKTSQFRLNDLSSVAVGLTAYINF
jgi:hypothetical protein